MIFGILVCICALGTAWGLSTEQCSWHNSSIFNYANSIAQKAAANLIPTTFARVVNGYMVLLVDESDGQASGGGTNAFGSYSTMYFKAEEILPAGVCDITNYNGQPCDENGMTHTFMLGPADVIAFVGCTPPPMRYFGFDAILATRLTEEYPFYPGQNFGDTVSIANVNVTDRSSKGGPFDQPAVVLHSADDAASQAVAKAFESAGMSASTVSTRGIETSTVRLWDRSVDSSWQYSRPDILGTIFRMAVPLPGSEDAYKAYKTLVWPVQFYLAHDTAKAAQPSHPPLKTRESAVVQDEVSTLSEAYAALETAVNDHFLNVRKAQWKGTQIGNLTAEGYYDDWDYVISRKDNASYVAGTRDAMYTLPLLDPIDSFLFKEGLGMVLIGVLHRDVLGAAYSSAGVCAINAITMKYVDTHWFLDDELRGSAARYLPDHPLVDSLFAVDLYTDAGGCAQSGVPSQWCAEFDGNVVTKKTNFTYLLLGGRTYLVKETAVGPNGHKALTEKLVVFTM